jgi:hypothetical protein
MANGLVNTKSITRRCSAIADLHHGAQPDFLHATNYQDLWWFRAARRAAGDSRRQGDTLFRGLYTYD